MRALLLGVGLLVVGCVTPYQRASADGGYKDEKLGPGHYLVQVEGTPRTDALTLRSYFHRRASELCAAEGFASYRHALESGVRTTGAVQTSPTTAVPISRGWVVGEVLCVHSQAPAVVMPARAVE